MVCQKGKKIVLLLMVFFLMCTVVHGAQSIDDKRFDQYMEKAKYFANIDFDSVVYYANKAFSIADSMDDNNKKAEVYFALIRANIVIGNFIAAYNTSLKAQTLVNENNLTVKEPQVYMYLGLVYNLMGFTSEALKQYFKSIALYEALPEKEAKNSTSELYYYLADAYFKMGESKLAKKYLNQSILLAKEQKSTIYELKSYMLLAQLQTKLDSIRKYYALSDQIIAKDSKSQYKKVVLLNNKAMLNKAIRKYDLSKSQYLQAISIAREMGYKKYLANLYNNYAYLLMTLKNYDSARINLAEALAIAKKMKDIDLEASVFDSYSDYYKAIDNFKIALEYQDSSLSKRTEFRKNQKIQASLFLSTVFETEKKEKEILAQESKLNQFRAILFGAIALLAILLVVLIYYWQKTLLAKSRLETMEKEKSLETANALIEGENLERKRLAMDLHDGLGARLGSLRFMVDAFFKDSPHFDEISNSVNDISKHVRDLSHRLVPTQLDELGLVLSLQNLINSINQSSNISLELEANIEKRLESKLEINLFYLVYEMINNALKHSGGNSIFIQLLEHKDTINLSVEDNGVGFDSTASKDGHGLKNIKRRVDFLEGELIIDSRINEGTLFMIEIPKN